MHVEAPSKEKFRDELYDALQSWMISAPELVAADLPSTDMDAGDLLHRVFEHRYTFIPTHKGGGEWYYWNGSIHVADEDNLLDEWMTTGLANAMKDFITTFRDKLPGAGYSKDRIKGIETYLAPAVKYARDIRNERNHANLRKRIRTTFQRKPDYFDHDQQWAVMANGQVLDLENLDGDLLPPDMTRPVAKSLGVSCEAETRFPSMWMNALSAWVPEKGVQEYLQVSAGAALLGRGDAKNIVTLVGISHTGKSTYINVLRKIFGGYAGELPATAIAQKYGGASNFEQHKARGKRFLALSEPQNTKVDDAYLKSLAGGGEPVPTAKKGENSVEWYAQCVLHIAANHVPKIDTRDDAIVGRINIIGFDHVFAPDSEERVKDLEDQLIAQEGPAVFMWILEGARRYLELGYIPVPESVRVRGNSNVVEASAPLRWLLERVEDGKYSLNCAAPMVEMVTPKAAYDDFRDWCIAYGEKDPSHKVWLGEIERYNSMPAHRKGKRSAGSARVGVSFHALRVHFRTNQNCTFRLARKMLAGTR